MECGNLSFFWDDFKIIINFLWFQNKCSNFFFFSFFFKWADILQMNLVEIRWKVQLTCVPCSQEYYESILAWY